MQIISDTDDIKLDKSAVAIGKFDGFHLGHRLLTDRLMEMKSEGLRAVLLTFIQVPRKEADQPVGKNIYSREEKRRIAEDLGIDVYIEYPFTRELAMMSPEEFAGKILVNSLDTRFAAVGEDFRFGHNRAGDPAVLKELGDRMGFTVEEVPDVCIDVPEYLGGEEKASVRKISSTLIRTALMLGKMDQVNHMLGRTYAVSGRVVKGKRLGRTMGMPTMNLVLPEDKMTPREGVYASKTAIGNDEYYSVTNIGRNPTVKENGEITVETFLTDFDREVYDADITVKLYRYLRGEKKFSSADELQAQMRRDLNDALSYMKKRN
ncbi:MAG: riboflavin biosynthesis protein RibF [Lachnospiraceae bacterium]|nr:riboflavin biosynthesis protein RibF [Lachnospiraceae bacterium]